MLCSELLYLITEMAIFKLQQILEWLPSVDPQDINMVLSSKDECTSGRITIVSYDLMVRCYKHLESGNHRIIIVVGNISFFFI
jgi:hypothetical protein